MNEVKSKTQTVTKPSIFTKDFILLMGVTTLSGTAITTQMGTLPFYVKHLGGSNAISGIIVGILGIAALIFRLPIGYLLDRFGRKIILEIGLLILIIDFSALNIWISLTSLLVLRFIQGIGDGIQSTSTGSFAADIIPPDNLTEGLGYFSIAQSVPQAFGPMIGLTIVDHLGFQYLFGCGALLSLLAFGLSFQLKDHYLTNRLTHKSDMVNHDHHSLRSLFHNGAVIIPSTIVFLICLANSGIIAFIVQYARQNHLSGSSYYFLVSSIVTILVRIFSNQLLAALNQRLTIVISILLIASDFFLIAIATNGFQLLLAAAFYGAGIAVLLPTMNAIVLNSVSTTQKGSATAIFSAALDVAYGGGVIVLGFIASWFSFFIMFLTCGSLAILALGVWGVWQMRV